MLTSDEREAVRMAGQLYTHIADKVCGNGPTGELRLMGGVVNRERE